MLIYLDFLHFSSQHQIKKKAFNLLNRNNLSVNSSLLNCMSTVRVSCNICNKELCNKYFLRQHVEKSHKLTFDSYMEKYDSLSADAFESNYKQNQNLTHKLVRSILINHPDLLRTGRGQQSQSVNSSLKKSMLLRNRKLVRSLKQKKMLSLAKAKQEETARKRKYSTSSSSTTSCPNSVADDQQQIQRRQENMQAYMLEEYMDCSVDSREPKRFKPCLVYLPIHAQPSDVSSFTVTLKLKSLQKIEEEKLMHGNQDEICAEDAPQIKVEST